MGNEDFISFDDFEDLTSLFISLEATFREIRRRKEKKETGNGQDEVDGNEVMKTRNLSERVEIAFPDDKRMNKNLQFIYLDVPIGTFGTADRITESFQLCIKFIEKGRD